jgi:GT2 family glycosyltransferase
MNNDVVVTPGWLEEMHEALNQEGDKIGLVCPTFWGVAERQSPNWNNGRRFEFVLEPFSLHGVCFLFPRAVIEEIGDWDENFFFGGEDFDMVLRVRDANYRVVIARESFLYHYSGASARIFLGKNLEDYKVYHQKMLDKIIEKHKLDKEKIYEKFGIK